MEFTRDGPARSRSPNRTRGAGYARSPPPAPRMPSVLAPAPTWWWWARLGSAGERYFPGPVPPLTLSRRRTGPSPGRVVSNSGQGPIFFLLFFFCLVIEKTRMKSSEICTLRACGFRVLGVGLSISGVVCQVYDFEFGISGQRFGPAQPVLEFEVWSLGSRA